MTGTIGVIDSALGAVDPAHFLGTVMHDDIKYGGWWNKLLGPQSLATQRFPNISEPRLGSTKTIHALFRGPKLPTGSPGFYVGISEEAPSRST